MLYTRKGDGGDTYFYGCNQRFTKSSELAEALGALDETNSLLGFCKVKARSDAYLKRANADNIFDIPAIIENVQQNLFIIQANLAGADKKISKEKIEAAEKIIDEIEKLLPPIKSFFIPGGTELAALLDYARAAARRAERRAVALSEFQPGKIQPEILAYLNRLSSLLYALARYLNFKAGIEEIPPSYE